MRKLLTIVLSLVAAGSPARADEPSEPFSQLMQPFFQRHCVSCHGPQEQQGQIRYDQLDEFRLEDRNLWTLIHEKLSEGGMPPKGHPQPNESEKRRILRWIEQKQAALGSGSTRRLNRRELSAALRDVTGLAVDYAAALPGDGKVNGFDTGADGLQDAADSVSQIMHVTRQAVEALWFLEPPSGRRFIADLVQAKDPRKAFDPWKSKEKGESISTGDTVGLPGTGLLIKPKWVGERGGLTIRLPLPPDARLGVLRLTAVVSMKKFIKPLPNPRLWVDVGGKDLDYAEITNTPDKPRELVYEVQLSDVAIEPRGITITLCNRVELPYSVPGFENDERKEKTKEDVPGGIGLFRPSYDHKKTPVEEQPVPFVVLHRIEIALDHCVQWPPAEWQCDVGVVMDDVQSAERLLKLWMERVWRRPLRDEEPKRFLELYENLRGRGLTFDEALRGAFQAVLMSGSFRYLQAPEQIDSAAEQHALASRLSFMLWGTPPDEELRRLAAAGELRDARLLDEQVDRLLGDPRSELFLRSFIMQWLEMGQPITVAMDHLQKQDFRFGRYLKASMQDETVAYFRQLLAENRPAREIIASDWTMMNDILARHYGYQGIEGGHLRKVRLRSDDPRGGGILGHAGIQSMLCWMGENWVIYRGAWALRHILDDPPPPPPLEVPELLPSEPQNHGKTFKELLRQHQEDSRCSVCHRSIDPLGFAFQNFDLSGRWRDAEYDRYVKNDLDGKIEWRGEGRTRPVDASGTLPRGEAFETFDQCKQLIAEHYLHDVVRGLLKNLLLYGTGRIPDIEDGQEIRAILSREETRGYPLRDLLKGVIRSRAFVER